MVLGNGEMKSRLAVTQIYFAMTFQWNICESQSETHSYTHTHRHKQLCTGLGPSVTLITGLPPGNTDTYIIYPVKVLD